MTDLPLIERRPSSASTDTLALILSGDGGWTRIDQALAAAFVKHGIAVVGLSSPRYFWTPRTPAGAAQDLERLLDSYLAHWCKQRIILVGFSTGADVLPFLVNRWPQSLIRRLQVVALLGPSPVAAFEFHLLDWVRYKPLPSALPVQPEIQHLKGLNLLCLYGEQDHGTLCPALDAERVNIIHLRGGHHFAGDYSTVAQLLLKESGEPGVSSHPTRTGRVD